MLELCARGTFFKMQTIFLLPSRPKGFGAPSLFSCVLSPYKERGKTFGSGGSDRNGYGCLRLRRCENVTIVENSSLSQWKQIIQSDGGGRIVC